MGEVTKIQWTDSSLNFWVGCSKVGPGCLNCYAEDWAKRYERVKFGPGETRVRTVGGIKNAHALNRKAAKGARPHLVFTNSLADFWDKEADDAWRHDALDCMAETPHLLYQVLTKRITNVERMMERYGKPLPPNVFLGVTAVNQQEWDRDIPTLVRVAKKLRALGTFVSMEPMLGPIEVQDWVGHIDWVICGGESGPKARGAAHIWFIDVLRRCDQQHVAFFMKQMAQGRPIPDHLMVREWPDQFNREDS